MIYILIRGRRMWVLHKFLCNKEFQVICLIIIVSKFWKVQVSRGLFWDILRKLNEVVLVRCWWRELILWVLFCKAIASLSVTLSILNAPTASVSAVSLWWAGSDKLQAKKKTTKRIGTVGSHKWLRWLRVWMWVCRDHVGKGGVKSLFVGQQIRLIHFLRCHFTKKTNQTNTTKTYHPGGKKKREKKNPKPPQKSKQPQTPPKTPNKFLGW